MIGRGLLDSFYVWRHQTMSYSQHGRAMASVGIVLAEADLASTASGPPQPGGPCGKRPHALISGVHVLYQQH